MLHSGVRRSLCDRDEFHSRQQTACSRHRHPDQPLTVCCCLLFLPVSEHNITTTFEPPVIKHTPQLHHHFTLFNLQSVNTSSLPLYKHQSVNTSSHCPWLPCIQFSQSKTLRWFSHQLSNGVTRHWITIDDNEIDRKVLNVFSLHCISSARKINSCRHFWSAAGGAVGFRPASGILL